MLFLSKNLFCGKSYRRLVHYSIGYISSVFFINLIGLASSIYHSGTTGVLTGTGREELISWVRGYPKEEM